MALLGGGALFLPLGVALLPGLAWLNQHGSLRPARRQRLLNVAAAGYFGLLACAIAVGPTLVWVLGAVCAAVLVAAASLVVLAAPVTGLTRSATLVR